MSILIYNSRNLWGLIDNNNTTSQHPIYNSRNLWGLIDTSQEQLQQAIYNSRNLWGLIDFNWASYWASTDLQQQKFMGSYRLTSYSCFSYSIYNSRNLWGLIDIKEFISTANSSTTVEIYGVLSTTGLVGKVSIHLQQQKFMGSYRHYCWCF